MNIQLRYFASLRETLGLTGEQVTLPAQVHTVADLRAWLGQRGEVWQRALTHNESVRAALNQVVCSADTPLVAEAEVAFFPPVTGG